MEKRTNTEGGITVKDIRTSFHTFTFGSADEAKTSNFSIADHIRGEVIKMLVTLPEFATPGSATVTGWNQDGKEIFESDAMAHNEEYDITLIRNEFILFGVSTEQLKMTLSGAPGSGGAVATVEVAVER